MRVLKFTALKRNSEWLIVAILNNDTIGTLTLTGGVSEPTLLELNVYARAGWFEERKEFHGMV